MDLPQNLLNESELDDKLSAQIQQTLQTENELASLVKQRDESKQKSDQIQQLTSGYVYFVLVLFNFTIELLLLRSAF